jgi:hypothetical protein
VWSANAFGAPVLHIRRLADGHLFSTYIQSFEAVWKGVAPGDLGRTIRPRRGSSTTMTPTRRSPTRWFPRRAQRS